MKTFEEALNTRLVKDESELDDKMSAFNAYAGIFDEIVRHPDTTSFIASVISSPLPEGMETMDQASWLVSIVMSAFMNGVAVGIEMEKQ